jgi:TonB family protein
MTIARRLTIQGLLCAGSWLWTDVAAQHTAPAVTPAHVIAQSCPWPDRAAPGSPAWDRKIDLRFRIAATGDVMDVLVRMPTGDGDFDVKLVAAARQCRAEPAMQDGVAIESWLRLAFTLRDPSAPTLPPWPPGLAGRSCALPDYPAESVRLEEQGTTRLRFTIRDDGQLLGTAIETSSGSPRLDAMALAALSRCRMRVGRTADNKPLGGSFIVEYVWRLLD